MQKLYSAPLRVYLLLLALALAGLFAGLNLPISLYPNSSKPTIDAYMQFGSFTAEEFLHSYGSALEDQLRSISTNQLKVVQLRANYDRGSVFYQLEFQWGCPDLEALREVQNVINGFAGRFRADIRNSLNIWSGSNNSGFISVSFYSATRSLDGIFEALDPVLSPQLARIPDIAKPVLYNPERKDVIVELNPERMASLGLLPMDVSRAIESGLIGLSGGTFVSTAQQYAIQMPRALVTVEDVARLPVRSEGKSIAVHLGDIAKVDYAIRPDGERSYKTNGSPSIMLWAEAKAGGNVKEMSEDVLRVIEASKSLIPSDIHYKVIVDPSEFIRSAVHNVMREVLFGGLLAVSILFLFIGSWRNTVTAAVEIPLSMVLAFIPMKLLGMNLNLISLGGLALSAGMNVDASVVVMENIFRHFERIHDRHMLSWQDKLRILTDAVAEIRFPVIASTVCSLIVFLPLAFTSKVTNAVLGDLAKAVVFSHGFSAVVALVLVPTVRLQLMSWGAGGAGRSGAGGGADGSHGTTDSNSVSNPISPLDGALHALEDRYVRALSIYLSRVRWQAVTYIGLAVALVGLVAFVLPNLPREVIGMPDTDWIKVGISASGNTQFHQMEARAQEVETKLLADFGDRIQYTYTGVYQITWAEVMAKLKDKSQMKSLWKDIEADFRDTPQLKFRVDSWNPAELPLPDPPDMKIGIQGGSLADRASFTRELKAQLEDHHVLPRLWSQPYVSHVDAIILRPDLDRWATPGSPEPPVSTAELADLVRVATVGKESSIEIPIHGKNARLYLRYPDSYVKNPEDIGSLPVGVDGKLIPLRGLTQVSVEPAAPTIYREDGREAFYIFGRKNTGSDVRRFDYSFMDEARKIVAGWNASPESHKLQDKVRPTVVFEVADQELRDALDQLFVALGLSVLLILLTLVIQFGDFMNALIVLVAIPLGFIGALSALYVFRSTLSLNSLLGVILLNGIAVANSIILVDFQKKLVDQGLEPTEAALKAARQRLRPILITSLTTILSMLPVAFGLGEGGHILQPLGISVAGGMWFSMGLTLFVVPALQTSYLKSLWARKERASTNALATKSPADAS